MVLTIEVSPDVERDLREAATLQGRTTEAVAADVLQSTVASRPLAEILKPFRQAVAASKVTECELDEFFQELRQQVWDAKQVATP